MRELTVDEAEFVSGAGIFGFIVGGLLGDTVGSLVGADGVLATIGGSLLGGGATSLRPGVAGSELGLLALDPVVDELFGIDSGNQFLGTFPLPDVTLPGL